MLLLFLSFTHAICVCIQNNDQVQHKYVCWNLKKNIKQKITYSNVPTLGMYAYLIYWDLNSS